MAANQLCNKKLRALCKSYPVIIKTGRLTWPQYKNKTISLGGLKKFHQTVSKERLKLNWCLALGEQGGPDQSPVEQGGLGPESGKQNTA